MNKQNNYHASLNAINTCLWVAVVSAWLLLIPALTMQITDEVQWTMNELVIMGALLFCAGSAAVLLWNKIKPS